VKVNWILYGGKERERETWRVLICGRFCMVLFLLYGWGWDRVSVEDSELLRGLSHVNLECVWYYDSYYNYSLKKIIL